MSAPQLYKMFNLFTTQDRAILQRHKLDHSTPLFKTLTDFCSHTHSQYQGLYISLQGSTRSDPYFPGPHHLSSPSCFCAPVTLGFSVPHGYQARSIFGAKATFPGTWLSFLHRARNYLRCSIFTPMFKIYLLQSVKLHESRCFFCFVHCYMYHQDRHKLGNPLISVEWTDELNPGGEISQICELMLLDKTVYLLNFNFLPGIVPPYRYRFKGHWLVVRLFQSFSSQIFLQQWTYWSPLLCWDLLFS